MVKCSKICGQSSFLLVLATLHHGVMGSDRDMQSSGSSISLPSVKKAPKKRRISLASFFRRRRHESKNQRSRELQLPGSAGLTGMDGIASIESIHSEMCNDKNSAPSSSTSASSCSKVAVGIGAELMECPLCLLRHSRESFPDIMTCYHRSCIDCLRQYLRIEILESRVNISCPECSERFNPHDICMILGDRLLMEKYEEFMLRRWLVADPDCRWCPAPDCG
uniref:RBR-type E3 ubiquitin transferase n=1 Tax=Oryzias sinensis TaxID=183150 RepID=A0A8C7WYU4_9TELE